MTHLEQPDNKPEFCAQFLRWINTSCRSAANITKSHIRVGCLPQREKTAQDLMRQTPYDWGTQIPECCSFIRCGLIGKAQPWF